MATSQTSGAFGQNIGDYILGIAALGESYAEARVNARANAQANQAAARNTVPTDQNVGAVPTNYGTYGPAQLYQPNAPVFLGLTQRQALLLFGGMLVVGISIKLAGK